MDVENSLSVGQVVRSKAGRDRSKIFLVMEVLDAKHVLVADGNLRPLESPKKKRTKHLQPYNMVLSDIATMKNEKDFNNATIRRLLKPFLQKEEANGEQGSN